MLTILLKKQFFEIFRSWFYNGKTGKAKSKGSMVGSVVLLAFLLVVIVGGSFTAIAIGIAQPLYSAGVGYLYFIIFGLFSVVLGLFGTVFNTYSGLYLAKDNDLLLSLPIPSGLIVAARLFSTYLMGVLYSAVVFVPGTVVWQIVCGFDMKSLIGNIGMLFEISLLVWVLSCLLGFAVAKISLKLKNRSFITVLAALAFMGFYYFVYFKVQVLIRDLVANAAQYGEKIKGSAYILYLWGQNGTGHLPDLLICLAFCIMLAVLTWLLLSKTFIGIATAAPKKKRSGVKVAAAKVSSLSETLLKKEFSRFTSGADYMLNCGLGTLFLTVAGIFLLIKGKTIIFAFSDAMGNIPSFIPVVIAGIGCMLASMNDSASPSISLEGKTLWILQSLPIEPWYVLKAKIKVQLFLTEIPMLLVCAGVALLPLSFFDRVACMAILLIYPVLSALFNMMIGLKMPVFNWTNEIVPIKQSGGVAIALFGGWGYAALMIGGYIGLSVWMDIVNIAFYLAGFIVLTLAVCAFLCRWLKTKGSEVLKSL